MYCKHCGKEISETAKFCDECGTPVVLDSMKETKLEVKKTKKPLYIVGGILIAIVVLVAGILFVNHSQKQKEREAYISNLSKFHSQSLNGAAMAESVCGLTYKDNMK